MVFKFLSKITRKFIPQKWILKLINFAFNSSKLDPLLYSYNRIGILNYKSSFETGEDFFIESILAPFLNKHNNQIIFDVGANTGEYSMMLTLKLPKARVFSFEPLSIAFLEAESKFSDNPNVEIFNVGLGSRPQTSKIYSYKNQPKSQHATLLKDVFSSIHNSEEIEGYEIKIETIQELCKKLNIDRIHFLKIDTEGFEMEVLKGADSLIKNKSIDFIQFEFNEMNVFSRVFLKDFFDLLDGYIFFRLNKTNLVPLGNYNTFYEIFKFQNIIAVRKEIQLHD